MKNVIKFKIHIMLMILGINFLFTTILGLMNEYNVFSYVLGICAMGVTNVLMDWRLNR